MNSHELTLSVYGMRCQKCVARVTEMIKHFPQVADVSVSLEESRAEIFFHPDTHVQRDKIIDVLHQAGFSTKVEKVQENPTQAPSDYGTSGPSRELRFSIGGMSCASCAATIEKRIAEIQGIDNVAVNLAGHFAQVHYQENLVSKEQIYAAVDSVGFKALDTEEPRLATESRKEFILVLVAASCALPIMLMMFFAPFGETTVWVNALLASIAQWTAGTGFYVSAWKSLKNRFANMDVLVALGITGAYGYSLLALFGFLGPDATVFFETSAMLILFIRFGKWLEARAKGRAGAALKKLLELQADSALLLVNGKEVEVPASTVLPGNLFVVRPGDTIPVDGEVVEGGGAVDESMITGESLPIVKETGSQVIGATLNKSGRMVARATAVGKDSVLSKIVRLVEDAQGDKPPIQRFADRVSNVFVPIVILLSLITFGVWFWAVEAEFLFAFQMSIAVVVIACPCALGLATPTAIMIGSSVGLEHGVLFKKATTLEQIGKLQVLLLDKTGTLTRGVFQVDNIVVLGNYSPDRLLFFAAAVEAGSNHPLARGIVAEAARRKIDLEAADHLEEIGGHGIRGTVSGIKVTCGSKVLIESQGFDTSTLMSRIEESGHAEKSLIFIVIDDKLQGVVLQSDGLKHEAAELIRNLRHMGIRPVMVSGDRRAVAESIGREIGLEQVEAEVLPEQKLDIVRKYQRRGFLVGMVGDGINDAPALAQADVGIAIGNGTDVAKETGDLVLISGDLFDIERSIKLGRKTLKKVKQNLFWAFFYNSAGIPLAAGLFYPLFGLYLKPEFAGLAMALSSVSVVSNSLLLRRAKSSFVMSD